MEKLKIINRSAIDLGDQFGLASERRNELAKKLDLMVKEASSGDARIVHTINIIESIHSFCTTQEEYTWALINHIQWMYKTGRMLIVLQY